MAGCATELALDDVILTECAVPEPPCPSNSLVIKTFGPAAGSIASSADRGKYVNNKRARSNTIKAPKKSNSKVAYRVHVSSTEKKAVVHNVGVIVTIPAGITYKRAAIRPKSAGMPTVDGDSTTGTTLTWENLSVAYKKSLVMKVIATVSTSTPLNTPLTFTAGIFTPDSAGEESELIIFNQHMRTSFLDLEYCYFLRYMRYVCGVGTKSSRAATLDFGTCFLVDIECF